MDKHYLFKFSKPIPPIEFEDALAQIGIPSEAVSYTSPEAGEFIADASFFGELEALLALMRDDFGTSITFLVSHSHTAFDDRLLKEAEAYFPNQAMFPTDVIMKEMSYRDYSSYQDLRAIFERLPRELLLTAGTYLRCGLDATLSAKRLFVHRNTFLYRLNRFIELTNLDIRDYHNALFLELYFQLSAGRGLA
jgi:hypothetical protein